MDTTTAGAIALGLVAVLLVLGMPIGFIFLIAGSLGVFMVSGLTPFLGVIGGKGYDINASYELAVIPLFILMGQLTYFSGITEGLYRSARAWLGHLKGGLVMATTVANAAFGACCGSTTAATAVFGKVAIPEMLRQGIDRRLAAGCVAASGSLSAIIPPSVLIVVYGILALESIAKLLVAGIIPGVIQVLIFSVMVYVRATINPRLAPSAPAAPWGERLRSIRGVWGVVVLFVVVMGGIWAGIFTPTEGGGIGAMGAFLLVVAARKVNRTVFDEAFLETARTAAAIFIIITGVRIFTVFLGLTHIPAQVSAILVGLPVPPVVIIISFLLLLVALGCLLEPMSMMFLTMPLMLPIVRELGYNTIWFGILVVTTCEMGMVTPPMGLNCFMLKSVVPELSLGEIFSGIWWYIAMWVVALAFYLAFPQIILFLPGTMFQ